MMHETACAREVQTDGLQGRLISAQITSSTYSAHGRELSRRCGSQEAMGTHLEELRVVYHPGYVFKNFL